MSDKVSRNIKGARNKKQTLQSFVACLYYLSEEADREDLPSVRDIFREAIGSISAWSSGRPLKPAVGLVDSSLFEAMGLLHKLLNSPPAERVTFINAFAALGDTFDHRSSEKRAASYIS